MRKPFKPIDPFHFRLKGNRPHFTMDTDRDRVPDWYDCRPFDRRKQHVGASEIEGNMDEVYSIVMKNALRKYRNPEMILQIVTKGLEDFFSHPESIDIEGKLEQLLSRHMGVKAIRPTDNVEASWYDTSLYIVDIWDKIVDVHHYVYMAGKKTVARPGVATPIVSITSVDRERMGEEEFDKLVKHYRKLAKDDFAKRK